MMTPRFLRFASSFVLVAAAACGGSSVDQTSSDPPSSRSEPPRPTPPSVDVPPAAPGNAPTPATCTPHPSPVQGTSSCEVARDRLLVDAVGVEWIQGTAWKAGAVGKLKIRYRNMASNSGIHYPGVEIASSDMRVRTETEEHADGFIHPDFYMIPACSTEEIAHAFKVNADLAPGAKITFTLRPAVATGDGIGSCEDTLRKSAFDVVVP